MGQLQSIIIIVIYLKFVIGETVSTAESQRDEFHAAKARNTKVQLITTSAFNMDVMHILGGLG